MARLIIDESLSPVQLVHGLPTPEEYSDECQVADKYSDCTGPQPLEDAQGIDQRRLDIRLQLSRLAQSLNDAALLDNQGFWNGKQEDEGLRFDLLEVSLRLQKMFTPPMDTIQMIAQAHHLEAALRYAVHHKIAQNIPMNGSIMYRDLAAQAFLHEGQCRRILRLLISHHIFTETSFHSVSHTSISRQLLDPSVCAWIEYQTTDSLKASTCLTEALTAWPGSLDNAETSFSMAHKTDLPMFEYLAKNGKMDRFRKAMTGMARQPAFSERHALAGYPWHQLVTVPERAGIVVDVGGGVGHVASAVSDAYPSLKLKVQDIGIKTAYSKGSIDFAGYNFFEPQPVQGADVYLLRQILHDWSNDYAVKILRNQIGAMKSHSKLIIMDMVMPRPGEWSLAEERKSRTTDVTMLTLFNAGERELCEWTELVTEASYSALKLTHFARPTGSILSIMEFSTIPTFADTCTH